MFQFNPFTGTLDLNSGPGSYTDDVVEYGSKAAFPVPGEAGKLYIDRSTDRAYRWSEGGTSLESYREVSGPEVTQAELDAEISALGQRIDGKADLGHEHFDPDTIRIDAVYAYGSAWGSGGDSETEINGLYLRDGSDDGKGIYRNANGYVIFWSENYWRLGNSSRSFSYFATDEDTPFPWGDAGNPLPPWELGTYEWPPFTPPEIKIPPTIIQAALALLPVFQRP